MPAENRKTRPSGPLDSRCPDRPPLLFLVGSTCVNVLILETVWAAGPTDKVQCCGDSVVRFGPGAAAAARPRQRSAAALAARGGPARGHPERPAARRRAAAVIARAGS